VSWCGGLNETRRRGMGKANKPDEKSVLGL
jgi:hypothetical protein